MNDAALACDPILRDGFVVVAVLAKFLSEA